MIKILLKCVFIHFIIYLLLGCCCCKTGSKKTLKLEEEVKNIDEERIKKLDDKSYQCISYPNFGLLVYFIKLKDNLIKEIKEKLDLKNKPDTNFYYSEKIPWYFYFENKINIDGIFEEIKNNQGAEENIKGDVKKSEENSEKVNNLDNNQDICTDKNYRFNKTVIFFDIITEELNDKIGKNLNDLEGKSYIPDVFYLNVKTEEIDSRIRKCNNTCAGIIEKLSERCKFHNGLHSINIVDKYMSALYGIKKEKEEEEQKEDIIEEKKKDVIIPKKIENDFIYKNLLKKTYEESNNINNENSLEILVTGEARIGKSTFLNVLSSISPTTEYGNIIFFKNGDDKLSTTRDVNSILFKIEDSSKFVKEEYNLILSDSPGIEGDGKKDNIFYEDLIIEHCKKNRPDFIIYLVKADREKAYEEEWFDLYNINGYEDKEGRRIKGQKSELEYIKELIKLNIPIVFCILQSQNYRLGMDTLKHLLSCLSFDLGLYKINEDKGDLKDNDLKDSIFSNIDNVVIVPMQLKKEEGKYCNQDVKCFGLYTLFQLILGKLQAIHGNSENHLYPFWGKKLYKKYEIIQAILSNISFKNIIGQKFNNEYFEDEESLNEEKKRLEDIRNLHEEYKECLNLLKFCYLNWSKSFYLLSFVSNINKSQSISSIIKEKFFAYAYTNLKFNYKNLELEDIDKNSPNDFFSHLMHMSIDYNKNYTLKEFLLEYTKNKEKKGKEIFFNFSSSDPTRIGKYCKILYPEVNKNNENDKDDKKTK